MSIVDRMHESVLRVGGVPPSVVALVELDQQIGHKFEYRPAFDLTAARFWLGLAGHSPPKLPDAERLRLANLLRRAGSISDEELSALGMIASAAPMLLERIQHISDAPSRSQTGYDQLPFENRIDR